MMKVKAGEIIWAKIRGFPWWPGQISKIEGSDHNSQELKVLVNFIGDPTHAIIPLSKIEKFDKKFNEFSKTKKKTLITSIALAKKIIKGELTFEKHMNFMKIDKYEGKKKNNDKENDINSSDEENENKKQQMLASKRLRKKIS